MMTEKTKSPRKPIWAGLIALLGIVLSVHFHMLYGRLHWPGADPQKTRVAILDTLHLDSFLVAVFALGLSIFCLTRGNRILGLVALVLSIGAVMNSMICF